MFLSLSGNELEKALRQIGRPDVIRKCMKNLEGVTDDDEKQLARERLGIGIYYRRVV